MSDSIGSAVARATQGQFPSVGQGTGDTGVRQVPVLGPDAGGPSFGDSLKRALSEVSNQQDTATETIGKFLRGDTVELHQVMAASEEAQLSLEMLIEVRNKFTDAYKSLVNMQG